jgi:hypothetical protein
MFVGRGLSRGASGLGLLEPNATGYSVTSNPQCMTSAERAEAHAKCETVSLRGLGATRALAPMTGRFAGKDPCSLLEMPLCGVPACIDGTTIGMIMGCISGLTVPGVDCADPMTAWTLAAAANLPFCTKPVPPACLTNEELSYEFYALAHPACDGPDKSKNAMCWIMRHDPAFWAALQSKLLCTPAPAPAKAPPPPPPVKAPPAAPPPVTSAPPPAFTPPEETPPGPPEHREASMMGLWGILALVAVSGGGYYMYRRYKR